MTGETIRRRDFFRMAARGGTATLLGAIGALLGKRAIDNPAKARSSQSCNGSGHCSACGTLASCGHPRGLSARSVILGQKEDTA